MNTREQARRAAEVLALAASLVLIAGCPPGGSTGDLEYDAGFAVGFAQDAEYWQGFDDSWDTVDFGPIYYQGSDIPYVESPPYDAGYWDGVWYAYNDGYFVAYDYAFTIGFSEGYDLAFGPEWLALLTGDAHIEYLDGGFSDGYNDGFSEGRILGATDWLDGLDYDWIDAMLYYREGNDLYIEELDLGTGVYGPVYLYEYGTDPADLLKRVRVPRKDRATPRIRNLGPVKAEMPELSYRAIPEQQQGELDVRPALTPRSDWELGLTTSWLERVNAYRTAMGTSVKSRSPRSYLKD